MNHNKPNIKLEDVINYNTLQESVYLCKQGKMWKDSMIDFSLYDDIYITQLLDSIYNGTFRFDLLNHFYVNERGKIRLICNTTVKDRVVQKAINRNYILKAYMPRLIYDNCASIKYKGLDFAINRLKGFLETAYNMWGYNFYIAKFDLHHYFDTIPHQYCYDKLTQFTDDPRIMNLFKQIFQLYKEDPLIHNGDNLDYGIGLGGEIPQSMGIITLDEYDHIIKEYYKMPFYIRYMDDSIIIFNDYNKLLYIRDCLSSYLNAIGLEYNTNKTVIIPGKEGVKFLKIHFIFNNAGIINLKLDESTVTNERQKLIKLNDKLHNNIIDYKDIMANFASWLGCASRSTDINKINNMKNFFNQIFIENWLYEIEL